MVGNNVGLESPTYRNNCGEYRKTVITRSDKLRSNRIHIEKDEIGATHVALCDNIGSYFINWCIVFRYTPLAMTDKRLRNKCAMTCFAKLRMRERVIILLIRSIHHSPLTYSYRYGLFTSH